MSLAEGPASTLKRRDDERRSTWIWGLVCGLLLLGAIVLGASAIQVAGRSGGDRGAQSVNAAATLAVPAAAGADEVPTRSDPGATRRTAIVEAAHRVGPAVVTISVVQTRMVQSTPFGSEFFEPFFRDMIPSYRYREQIPGMGSGFIISPKGYVLTNEHVVSGAEKITVILADGRSFTGKVLGSHPQYDVAIVKIEGENLPVAPLGSSSDLMVGEWAIAIGNPFGFLLNDTQPTVTAGVISATARDIKAGSSSGGIYKNMIQTDAAINPGNSGGPLVNALGQVIGVNTFIFTKSGGSEGIGFAIPIDAAKRVVDEIIKYGRVRNIWIGVGTWDITPYLAERIGTKDRNGLYISSVEKGSPADKAAARVGDIIRKVNGTAIGDVNEAYRAIFGANVGDTVTLTVERDGKLVNLRLILEELQEEKP
ncbi:MAG: trypsin-like serine protease [Candidatus Eisenbacteria bacterium]|uniref:Trypsin-like serine protease n=2 Tax=Eiseniibacteriota bacterium TaxID=2212470 RepID=A0A538SDF7_UNCEI|nr:MAG: trypsin-like serine protease [Candidatus Eisenbacteria bacterium]